MDEGCTAMSECPRVEWIVLSTSVTAPERGDRCEVRGRPEQWQGAAHGKNRACDLVTGDSCTIGMGVDWRLHTETAGIRQSTARVRTTGQWNEARRGEEGTDPRKPWR